VLVSAVEIMPNGVRVHPELLAGDVAALAGLLTTAVSSASCTFSLPVKATGKDNAPDMLRGTLVSSFLAEQLLEALLRSFMAHKAERELEELLNSEQSEERRSKASTKKKKKARRKQASQPFLSPASAQVQVLCRSLTGVEGTAAVRLETAEAIRNRGNHGSRGGDGVASRWRGGRRRRRPGSNANSRCRIHCESRRGALGEHESSGAGRSLH
jgi:hypothetical protein